MRRTLLPLFVVLLAAPAATARPAHKQALAEYFGPFLAKKLNDCRTCHLPDRPGAKPGDADRPHNVFGERLVVVRRELKKAGKKTTIADRLDAIAREDADGDGVSNLLELLTGHYPGEAGDKPDTSELKEAKQLLAAFARFRAGYPWRPFEVVKRPAVPAVKHATWVRNPIDAFIATEHEALGLKPRPEAPRAVLLRRVYLDLIGLPPTREQLHAFLADRSPDAYEQVVERLLASPQYGERWARHWMDVWRYSDWAGYGSQVRDSQPHVWRWRDWIVESLNADRGYDRMIVDMLAADELTPDDPQALRATGYLVRNFKLLSREKWLQDTVDHTAQAFLGLTLGCAKCHDHMYDPISQKEYYRVRAIFEPHHVRIDRVPSQPNLLKDGVARVYDKELDAKTFLFLRGDDRTPDKTPLAPGVLEALGGTFAVKPVKLSLTAQNPDKREFVKQEALTAAKAALSKAEAALKAKPGDALMELDAQLARARLEAVETELQAEALQDAGKQDSPEWVWLARVTLAAQREAAWFDARKKKLVAAALAKTPVGGGKKNAAAAAISLADDALAKAQAALQQPLTIFYTPRSKLSYPATSTGRRLAFARWIAHRDNPLTARVAVNHIWLRHLGQALVPSVFDFGRNGRLPSHPALLDWLAAEFMEHGWSMKHLHRLIVTSSVYRLASTPDEHNLKRDRDNKYLWRLAPRRAEAEVVRDSIFHVAGKLDLTRGGPDLPHTQGLTVPRRSLYFQSAAEKQMEFLAIFDGPSVVECYERKHSVVPQQALALSNSALVRRHARLLARSLSAQVKDDAAFVTAAFEQVLTRTPTAAELSECTAFLKQQAQALQPGKAAPADPEGRLPAADPVLRARENFIHVLMNHHEFVTIR